MALADSPIPLEVLLGGLGSKDPDERGSTALRLADMGPAASAAVPLLTRMLSEEPKKEVRFAALNALAKISDDPLPLLSDALAINPHTDVRASAARKLQAFPSEAIPLLGKALQEDPASFVRRASAHALTIIASNIPAVPDNQNDYVDSIIHDINDLLVKALREDSHRQVRAAAADDLGTLAISLLERRNGPEAASKAVAPLAKALREDAATFVRRAAIISLSRFSLGAGLEVPELYWTMHRDDDWKVRRCAAECLRAVESKDANALIGIDPDDKYEEFDKSSDIIGDLTKGHGGPVPTLEEKIKELTAGLPADYDGLSAALTEIHHAYRQNLADSLTPALTVKIQEKPHAGYEDKKELAKFVNAELRKYGLTIKCPKTGRPASLGADPGNHPAEGRFHLLTEAEDGKKVRTLNTPQLSTLLEGFELMPDDPDRKRWGKWADRVDADPRGAKRE